MVQLAAQDRFLSHYVEKEFEKLVHTISQRIANYLERRGLIQRDMENSYLNLSVDDEDSLLHLQGASVSYRIAIGLITVKKYLPCKPLHKATKMNMVSWQNQPDP